MRIWALGYLHIILQMQTFYFANLRIYITLRNFTLVGLNVNRAEFYKNLHKTAAG